MNIVLLYLLLLKGTVTAFAGLASLPVIQESLVNHYHVLTNEQLNEAVVITRSSPGPVGLYIVSVGYFAAGLPGGRRRLARHDPPRSGGLLGRPFLLRMDRNFPDLFSISVHDGDVALPACSGRLLGYLDGDHFGVCDCLVIPRAI
jgi:hypothetical protein